MSGSKSIKIIVLGIIVAIGIAATLLLSVNMEQDRTDTNSSNVTQTETNMPNPITNTVITINNTSQEQYFYKLENSINAKLMPEEPINKEVLAGHVFGFTPDNALTGGMEVIKITNQDEKLSIRFTAKFSGELTKLHLYFNGNDEINAKVGLQEDKQGVPSGQWLGDSPGYAQTIINSNATKFDTIELLENINVKENTIYHIVIDIDEDPESRFFMITYHDNWPFTPFNHIDPDEVWEDNAINTLFFDGSTWLVQDKWPIYVIDYSDGTSDGQPYSLMAPWVIKKSSTVGQTIRPYSNYLVDEFAFVVSLNGSPLDNLYYAVYDEENTILRSGTFATPDELTKKKSWHQVKLESPLLVASGELYHFVLSSPDTDLENPYKVYGHEFMLDQTLGYGSVNHYLTKSQNELSWSKWYDADTAFKLITK